MAIVLITGCSSGVGYDSALAFARRGDHVYACVRNPESAASLAQKGAEEKLDIRIKFLDVTASASLNQFLWPAAVKPCGLAADSVFFEAGDC